MPAAYRLMPNTVHVILVPDREEELALGEPLRQGRSLSPAPVLGPTGNARFGVGGGHPWVA
jgi:hypothetical protein